MAKWRAKQRFYFEGVLFIYGREVILKESIEKKHQMGKFSLPLMKQVYDKAKGEYVDKPTGKRSGFQHFEKIDDTSYDSFGEDQLPSETWRRFDGMIIGPEPVGLTLVRPAGAA